MTATMTTETQIDAAVGAHRCYVCGGPCLTRKGSEHGWTCRRCLAAYVEAGAAKADERLAAERAVRLAENRQRRAEREEAAADP